MGVPTGPFGPRPRAILTMFAGSYRQAKRPIQQLASDLFGLDISLGMIPELERRAAETLEPVVAEVAAATVAAPSAHIDETSWAERNAGCFSITTACRVDGRDPAAVGVASGAGRRAEVSRRERRLAVPHRRGVESRAREPAPYRLCHSEKSRSWPLARLLTAAARAVD